MDDGHLTFVSANLQPLDGPEAEAILRGVARGGRTVVLLRDAGRPNSLLHPLSDVDRLALVDAAFPGLVGLGVLAVEMLPWCGYDDRLRIWTACCSVVSHITAEGGAPRVHLWGFPEDEATAVMGTVTGACNEGGAENPRGTPDRLEARFAAAAPQAKAWLDAFRNTPAFAAYVEEDADAAGIREKYGSGPHSTADAVCTWRDRVLLVRRRGHPYRGTLAIPGGIVDAGEDPFAAAVRELSEEAGLPATGVPTSGPHPAVYAHPMRDPRGAYVAHAFRFDFSDLPEPPAVHAGDDASEAGWHPGHGLAPGGVAFDHFAILHDLWGLPFPVQKRLRRLTFR